MKIFTFFMKTLGTAFHIWTVVIAFKHSVLAGFITIFVPVLSEIYWFFKMIGENTLYVVVSIVYAIGAIIYYIMKERY